MSLSEFYPAVPGILEERLVVGIGEYRVGTSPMSSIGLGSCIALILHHELRSHGGMAHIMLPDSQGRSDRPGKFADTAVQLLLDAIEVTSPQSCQLSARLVGGACMFRQFSGTLNIGERNIEAVRAAVRQHKIRIRAEDVGGTVGRSLVYYPSERGKIIVRRADGSNIEI